MYFHESMAAAKQRAIVGGHNVETLRESYPQMTQMVADEYSNFSQRTQMNKIINQ
jgi:hypothetical protein